VIVTMTATSSSGQPKVVTECTYPLTATGAVDVIVTELCVFRFRDHHLVLTEVFDGARVGDVAAVIAAPFEIDLDDVSRV
jgi:acyl CoA:acetate/3-ketoacid CoA transferase beta subunit